MDVRFGRVEYFVAFTDLQRLDMERAAAGHRAHDQPTGAHGHLMALVQEIPTAAVSTGVGDLTLYKWAKPSAQRGRPGVPARATLRYFIDVDAINALQAVVETKGNSFFAERLTCFI